MLLQSQSKVSMTVEEIAQYLKPIHEQVRDELEQPNENKSKVDLHRRKLEFNEEYLVMVDGFNLYLLYIMLLCTKLASFIYFLY